MSDIVSQIAAFIRARLAEDERGAKAASPGPWLVGTERDHLANEVVYGQSTGWPGHIAQVCNVDYGQNQQADAVHIARHNPARVLRRAGGMREILNSYDTAVRELERALMRARAESVDGRVPDDVQATLTRKQVKIAALEWVVLRLSLEFFDHDGYLDEWKQVTGPLAR